MLEVSRLSSPCMSSRLAAINVESIHINVEPTYTDQYNKIVQMHGIGKGKSLKIIYVQLM